MITTIAGMPAGTIGFEATGTVTAEDYETVLVPALTAAIEAGPEPGVGPHRARGVRLEVVPQDVQEPDRAGHPTGWERIAVATDVDWVERAIKAFGWMMPGRIRLFDDDDVDEAKRWLVLPEED